MTISVTVPKAYQVADKTLITSAAYTSSDATNYFPVDFFSSADITAVVTTCSGTLDIYVQKLLSDATNYQDIAHMNTFTTATYTTSGIITASLVNTAAALTTDTDAGLAADTILAVNFGSNWRIKFVIAGASATATFGVYGTFRRRI